MSARRGPMAPIADRRACCWRCCRSATQSNTVINALVTAMIIALAAQGWNLLGGYGGQFSFGHAAFFGAGAYGNAILQARYGINAYAGGRWRRRPSARRSARSSAISASARGCAAPISRLITLAFAEVFRIIANATPITGGAAGTLIKLQVSAANFQFASRAIYFWIILALVVAAMLLMRAHRAQPLRRLSRRGARERKRRRGARRRHAQRQAQGDHAFRRRSPRSAGAFYVQYFLFVDAVDRLRHLDLHRGAAGADHRRSRHRVRSAARRAGAAFSRRIRQGRSPAAFPASIWRCSASCWSLIVAFARHGLQGLADRAVARLGARGGRHERRRCLASAVPASGSAVCWPSTMPA